MNLQILIAVTLFGALSDIHSVMVLSYIDVPSLYSSYWG